MNREDGAGDAMEKAFGRFTASVKSLAVHRAMFCTSELMWLCSHVFMIRLDMIVSPTDFSPITRLNISLLNDVEYDHTEISGQLCALGLA